MLPEPRFDRQLGSSSRSVGGGAGALGMSEMYRHLPPATAKSNGCALMVTWRFLSTCARIPHRITLDARAAVYQSLGRGEPAAAWSEALAFYSAQHRLERADAVRTDLATARSRPRSR